MRFSDIVLEEDNVTPAVIDLLAILAGEDTRSVPLEVVRDELIAQDIDIDDAALYDLLVPLDIVSKIEDDIVFFNTDSSNFSIGSEEKSREEQKDTVDRMARKKVDKEL